MNVQSKKDKPREWDARINRDSGNSFTSAHRLVSKFCHCIRIIVALICFCQSTHALFCSDDDLSILSVDDKIDSVYKVLLLIHGVARLRNGICKVTKELI